MPKSFVIRTLAFVAVLAVASLVWAAQPAEEVAAPERTPEVVEPAPELAPQLEDLVPEASPRSEECFDRLCCRLGCIEEYFICSNACGPDPECEADCLGQRAACVNACL